MQALILAAGMGKRLKELTKNNTKCMVEVDGISLIDRMLHQLERQHLSRIVIVVGYKGQNLIDYIGTLDIKTPIIYVNNPIYDKTNNIYSLALAKDYLCREDTLLFESDIIFDEAVIENLLADPRETLAVVDKYESWMDGTCVTLDDNDEIVSFVSGKAFQYGEIDQYYKTVNIYKFSRHFSQSYYVPFLEAYQKALGENEYYEQVLRVITLLDEPEIKAMRLHGERWYEIDDEQDLDIATSIFVENADRRVSLLGSRFGGYWRYPNLVDFCYLVNPYFPPQRLVDEMKASFDTLLTQYPSGMRVNALLAGKNFGVHQDNILVGNGAAELIKALMTDFTGKTGIIRPTFEEYGHRCREEDLVVFRPGSEASESDSNMAAECAVVAVGTDTAEGTGEAVGTGMTEGTGEAVGIDMTENTTAATGQAYRYTADDLMVFFDDKAIDNLILINPDNPSGNYIPKADLMRLIAWTRERHIRFLVDESFADFSDELDNTLIDQSLLDANEHLYVMKSISKSYGVPGIRLGVLASGDKDTIARMKKDVAIWNINSFGEFYLQIAEKYKKDYEQALIRFRQERQRYMTALAAIPWLKVLPSQANYVMVEITNGMTAAALTRRLLVESDILVKNLVPKLRPNGRQYLRLAVKNETEDDKLLEALRKI